MYAIPFAVIKDKSETEHGRRGWGICLTIKLNSSSSVTLCFFSYIGSAIHATYIQGNKKSNR